MDEFEISLQDTVLARCAVDGDVGIVELHELSVVHKREVVAVDWCPCAVGEFHAPVIAFHLNDIYIVALLVEERIESLCRAH